ncbi:hypothetical protein R1flu_010713 [Riccia fluitans]|uniref:Retrotransposon gag domain-containing protein n=1 Tax=Riccia fluitans TaxID=41844 RepID=A0ABD1Z634_9MARC
MRKSSERVPEVPGEFFAQMMATMKAMQDALEKKDERIADLESQGGFKRMCKPKQPTPFIGTGKAVKVKDFLDELDMYFDMQLAQEEEKVKVAATFLKDHALKWWKAF